MARRKILVVEDEYLLADDCVSEVLRAGFEVSSVVVAMMVFPRALGLERRCQTNPTFYSNVLFATGTPAFCR